MIALCHKGNMFQLAEGEHKLIRNVERLKILTSELAFQPSLVRTPCHHHDLAWSALP